MTGRKRRFHFYAVLLPAVMAAAVMVCIFCYRYDNKYTRMRPPANMGVIRLEDSWYQKNPVFYLADGWSFYQGKLLSPEEIPEHTPDAYFYIGRYGGFDLGDSEADPHGQGTYRTVILTEAKEREYALELTPIYSRWSIWINGKLVQSEGMGEEEPQTPVGLVTFTASGKIEIVVAAADEGHFYSGMVYPPAFGEPESVSRISSVRLLLHGIACGLALFIGIICLLMGIGCGYSRPYGALMLLCLSFCGSTAWPLFQIWGQERSWLLSAEKVGYYGIFLSLIWIQGRMFRFLKRFYYPVCAVGMAVCLSAACLPWIPFTTAAQMYAYSDVLSFYKWFTAVWLLAASGLAIYRNVAYSEPMMAGTCLFAAALFMDRFLPLYEPVYTGWFVELAGGAIILLTAGIIWFDMLQYYKDSVSLRMEQQVTRIQLEARARYAALSQEYVKKTRKQLHETKNRLILIRHYLDRGELDKLNHYLNQLALETEGEGVPDYSGHSLVDAILTRQADAARQQGIYMEVDSDRLTAPVLLADDELSSLLMNLLNNAIEACARLPAEEERWIAVQLAREGDSLVIHCCNSSEETQAASGFTSKKDKKAHGFGLKIIKEIAEKYGGSVVVERECGSFCIEVELCGVLGENMP